MKMCEKWRQSIKTLAKFFEELPSLLLTAVHLHAKKRKVSVDP
jgi:hypothetical protein